jgi:hypothetical protein
LKKPELLLIVPLITISVFVSMFTKLDYRVVMKSENITARKNAIEADFAIGPLPVSQLGDKLVPVPQLELLPPLPLYSLGLRQQTDASRPAKALGDFLKTSVNYNAATG